MGKKIFFKIILGVVFLLFICIYVGVFNNDDKIDYSDTSLEHGQYLVFESIADSGSLLIEKFTINKRGKEFEIRKSLKIVESDGTELDMGSYSIIVKPSGELSEEYSLNATLAKNHELKFLKSYMANHTNLFGPPNLKTGEIFFGNLKITGESQFKDFDTYYINLQID